MDVDAGFRELFSAVDAALDAAAARLGVNRTDLRCLEVLDRRGPSSAGALAEAVQLSPAAVTKIIDRLVGMGYVERARDDADRRRVVVRTSDHERRRRQEVFVPLVMAGFELLAELSDDELRLLRSVLEQATAVNRAHAARLSEGGDEPAPRSGGPGDDDPEG